MMFWGFRSRWITPSECAESSARQTCSTTAMASLGANFPSRRNIVRKSSPSTYSMLMKRMPSASPMSKMRTTFLCVILRERMSSCLKRCRIAGSVASSGRMTLSAIRAVEFAVTGLVDSAHAALSEHSHDLVAFTEKDSWL